MVQNEPTPTADDLERYALGQTIEAGIRGAIEADETLRRRVEELRRNNALLDEVFQAHVNDPAAPVAGEAIAGYRILGEIYRGGQGIVYKAVQESTNRTVALKLLREGAFATTRQRWRFEREIELVANLGHPNIVVVHESGLTDDGRLYFTMEYIDGSPLTEHAEGQRLGNRERLGLVATVCRAVHHAHQRGVIHRDLKPANILVTADGEPKVLDFGVASVTDRDLRATTDRTDVGQLIGTVPYMSPEQVSGVASMLDTRSDVYALGVVLYQLLTGQLPYDLEQKLLPEAVRVIREDDPIPLSSVDRVFRGDIETIVGKALEKDRARRYQSASELAQDIERFLAGDAILAHAPSAMYQIAKLARRHSAAVIAIAGIAVACIVSIVAISIFAASATSARGEAITARDEERAQRELAEARLDEVERARQDAETVFEVFSRTISSVRAGQGGRDATVRGMLELIDAELSDYEGDALGEAKLREVVGRTFLALTDLDAARVHLERAMEIRRAELAPGSPEVTTSLVYLGDLESAASRFGDAETRYREAISQLEVAEGPAAVRTLETRNKLAWVLMRQEKLDDARRVLDEAIGRWTTGHGAAHGGTLEAHLHLAEWHLHREEAADAEAILAEQLAIATEAHGARDRLTLPLAANYVFILRTQRRFDEAIPILQELLPAHEEIYGDDHPFTLFVHNSLARTLRDAGRFDEAEVAYRTMLERYRRKHEDEHQDVLKAEQRLAVLLLEARKLDEAERILRRLIPVRDRAFGETHLDSVRGRRDLGRVLLAGNRSLLALDELDRAHDLALRSVEDPDHPDVCRIRRLRASALRSVGRTEDAIVAASRALEGFRRSRPVPGHGDILGARLALGAAHLAAGDLARVDDACARVLEDAGDTPGEFHARALYLRGLAARARGNLTDAAADMSDALTIVDGALPRRRGWPGVMRSALGDVMMRSGHADEAREMLENARASLESWYGSDDPRTRLAAARLAGASGSDGVKWDLIE